MTPQPSENNTEVNVSPKIKDIKDSELNSNITFSLVYATIAVVVFIFCTISLVVALCLCLQYYSTHKKMKETPITKNS